MIITIAIVCFALLMLIIIPFSLTLFYEVSDWLVERKQAKVEPLKIKTVEYEYITRYGTCSTLLGKMIDSKVSASFPKVPEDAVWCFFEKFPDEEAMYYTDFKPALVVKWNDTHFYNVVDYELGTVGLKDSAEKVAKKVNRRYAEYLKKKSVEDYLAGNMPVIGEPADWVEDK